MIKNIIYSALMFDLLLAISLSLLGATHVSLGAPFISFMSRCSIDLQGFSISIPNIPLIPVETISLGLDGADIFSWFKDFATGMFTFLNFIINILNFIVLALNTLIELIRFIYIMLTNFKEFRDILLAQ